jgi:hypothetical protein
VQCSDAFGRPQLFAIDGDEDDAAPEVIEILDTATPLSEEELREFLGATWLYLEYEVPVIQALSEEQIDQVRSILASDEEELWANALTTLGLRGTSEDITLFESILRHEGRSEAVREAKLAVPQALGFLSYTAESTDAVALLAQMSIPQGNSAFLNADTFEELESDARIMALTAGRGLAVAAAAGHESAEIAGFNQMMSVDRGAFSLNVEMGFFEGNNRLEDAIRDRGLIEFLTLGADPH